MSDKQGLIIVHTGNGPELHLVLTGRDASPLLIEKADLVTEMKEVKHPYQKGITAQKRDRVLSKTPRTLWLTFLVVCGYVSRIIAYWAEQVPARDFCRDFYLARLFL